MKRIQETGQRKKERSPLIFFSIVVTIFFFRELLLATELQLPTFDESQDQPSALALEGLAVENKETANQTDSFLCENDGKDNTELGFVHIPKTGGSSIEREAKESQKLWGYYAFGGHRTNERWLSTKYLDQRLYGKGTPCLWHTPPFLLPSLKKKNKTLPYENQDLFAVIRNPFARIASEIHYRCNFRRKKLCLNKADVNHVKQEELGFLLNCTRELNQSTILEPKGLECLFSKLEGHLVPQWQFFYDPFSGERQIRYLLHFEKLSEDFQDLMESKSLNMSLGVAKMRSTNYSAATADEFRGVEDFDEVTRRLIVELYRKDFELGGYSLNISDTTSFSHPVSHGGVSRSTFWELPCQTNLE